MQPARGRAPQPRRGPGRVEWLLVVLALVVVAVFGTIGVRLFDEGARQHSWVEPFPNGAIATGTVQWALPVVSAGRSLYRSQIQFASQDGSTVSFLARPTVVEPAFGSRVTVSYVPSNPTDARVIGEPGVQWSTTYALGIVLVVLAAIVGLVLFTALIRWSWHPAWSDVLLRVVQAGGSAVVGAATGALLALSGDHPTSLAAFVAAGLLLVGVVAVAPGRPRNRGAGTRPAAPAPASGPFAPGGAGWHVAARWFALQSGERQAPDPGAVDPGAHACGASNGPIPGAPFSTPQPRSAPAEPGSWASWYGTNGTNGTNGHGPSGGAGPDPTVGDRDPGTPPVPGPTS